MSDLFIKHVHWYLSYNIRSIVATGLDRSDPQDKLWYSDKCDLYKPDLQKKKIKRELWISPKLLKCQVLTTWMKVGHQVCCCGGDARNKIQYKNFKILIMIFFVSDLCFIHYEILSVIKCTRKIISCWHTSGEEWSEHCEHRRSLEMSKVRICKLLCYW